MELSLKREGLMSRPMTARDYNQQAIESAVLAYKALCAQGGLMAFAAFGVAAAELQERLNCKLGEAAKLLDHALFG